MPYTCKITKRDREKCKHLKHRNQSFKVLDIYKFNVIPESEIVEIKQQTECIL